MPNQSELKNCSSCAAEFKIHPEDIAYYEKISPSFQDTKILIPTPQQCPECRFLRRLCWRNEYRYYARSCDLCSKRIVSVHSTDKPYPVYCSTCWWGDSWDPLKYSRDFDPHRPFIEQFHTLYQVVPQIAMQNDNGVSSENSEYCQDISFCKNCYLLTGSWHMQDTFYSTNCNHGRDVVDCDSVNLKNELAYECSDCQHLYHCTFLRLSAHSNNCHFGLDLRNCNNCIACVGLRQKSFCIFNKQLSESEYRTQLAELKLGSRYHQKALNDRFLEFTKDFPRKAFHQVQCEDCLGDNLFNCRDVLGFDTFNAEHCRYFYKGDSPKFCYDVHQSGNPQWCYECLTPDDGYMCAFSMWCWRGSKHLLYCDNCHASESLFGCVGLRRQKYCILNKQYSKEDFEALATSIIQQMQKDGTWGEFFPREIAPFGYNETVAFEYAPLSMTECEAQGLLWKNPEETKASSKNFKVPDSIVEVSDTIAGEILSCEECPKQYRILSKELTFYRQMNLPVPVKCPDCRRRARWSQRNPYRLWAGNCCQCQREVSTVYGPHRNERVLCEECYLVFLEKN